MLLRSLSFFTKSFSTINSNFEAPTALSNKELIESILDKGKIVIFMKGTPSAPKCGFSKHAIQVLSNYKFKSFHFYNILEDPSLREELKKYSDWPTYPQIYVNKEFIGGVDILVEMHKNSKLQELFEKHQVVNKD